MSGEWRGELKVIRRGRYMVACGAVFFDTLEEATRHARTQASLEFTQFVGELIGEARVSPTVNFIEVRK